MIGFWDFLNQHSPLNSTIYYSLLCLLLLGACGAFYSIAKELRRKKGLNAFWSPKEKLIAVTGNAIGKAMFVILGVLIGAGFRDHQLTVQTITYRNIAVLDKFNEREFLVHPEWMPPLHVMICQESTVDWQKNDKLDDWTFEQLPGCKRVLSYHRNYKGETNASLVTR